MYPHYAEDRVEKEARAFFMSVDTDGNGSIDFGEWCAATINKRSLLNETNLRTALSLFDKDGGGTISADEVAQILGHSLSKDQSVWKEIVKEVDLNGDGQIDFDEFK